ncbi:MAG: hypothetical protein OXI71_18565 [Gemmatimonadota bacterium]|nr:hypothetical protein [Gemmatimonadota bacterium]MXX34596.1 hypothetical protein [Gemmatimonadota bacterium]MYD12138.1 hypothetical protein [Gemmatimonadota bacterium]
MRRISTLEGFLVAAAGIVLVDTMIVIEAVDTGCWNAIAGQKRVVTVRECEDELRRGDMGTPGYVTVTDENIARCRVVALSDADRAEFQLSYPGAHRLDPGERDLLALASSFQHNFELCCCDKAAVVAAHALGLLGRVVSLESLAESVGGRPRRAFKRQYTERTLATWRTALLLESSL